MCSYHFPLFKITEKSWTNRLEKMFKCHSLCPRPTTIMENFNVRFRAETVGIFNLPSLSKAQRIKINYFNPKTFSHRLVQSKKKLCKIMFLFCRHCCLIISQLHTSFQRLRVRFFKSGIGFLNPKESENGFCVSLLDRSIQDISDHGASKEPKNPLWKWTIRFLWHTMIRKILDWSV